MRLLKPGGVILSASCSQALSHDELLTQMRLGIPKGHAGLQFLSNLRQGADHPVHASMPESLYLTGAIGRLI